MFIMGIINQSVYENREWFKNLFLFVWNVNYTYYEQQKLESKDHDFDFFKG